MKGWEEMIHRKNRVLLSFIAVAVSLALGVSGLLYAPAYASSDGGSPNGDNQTSEGTPDGAAGGGGGEEPGEPGDGEPGEGSGGSAGDGDQEGAQEETDGTDLEGYMPGEEFEDEQLGGVEPFGEVDALAAEDEFEYEINYGEAYIMGYKGSAKTPVIPAELEGKPVVSVGISYWGKSKSFTNIDFGAAVDLKSLNLMGVTLTNSLDLRNNEVLGNIYMSNCKLPGINLLGLTALTRIYIEQCNIPSLFLRSNTALKELSVYNESISFSSTITVKTTITSLDLSKNTALEILDLTGTKIAALDLSANKDLYSLTLSGSSVKSLDLSGNTELTYIDCYNNSKLTSLNITGCAKIQNLEVSNNALTGIDAASISNTCMFSVANNNISNPALLNTLIDKPNGDTYNVLPQKNVYYLINFDSMEGSDVASKGIKKGAALGTLTTPTKSEGMFGGWYPTVSGGTKVTAATKPTGYPRVITYYAMWGGAWDVVFKANGGEPAERTIQILKGAKIGKALPTAKYTGYTLVGWFKSGGEKVTANTVVSETFECEASWKANTYKLTLNAGGGVITTKTATVTYDETYGSAFGGGLPEPTRTGYKFDGWYTAKDISPLPGTPVAGTLIESSTTVKLLKATTLFAHWTAKDYEVTFDLNKDVHTFENGNDVMFATGSDTDVIRKGTVYYQQPFKDAIPAAVGKNADEPYYALTGWHTVPETTGGKKLAANTKVNFMHNDNVYYARWAEAFKVNWVIKGPSDVTTSTHVAKKAAIGVLPVPDAADIPPGYALKGWYTMENGGKKISASTKVNGETTYYTQWKPASFKVTYDRLDGGKTYTKNVTYLKPYGNVNGGTRTGYLFKGWWSKDGTIGGDWGDGPILGSTQVTETGPHTVYAKWEPRNNIIVKFNVNGGTALSAADSQRTVTFRSTLGPLPEPVRADSQGKSYVFNGWYTAKSGGKQVTEETLVDFASTKTYFAQWITSG